MIHFNRNYLAAVLADFGFVPQGGRTYHADSCHLTIGQHWWVLRRKTSADVDWFTRRGLWKLADAAGREECCDLPVGEMALELEDVRELLAWVLDDTHELDVTRAGNDASGVPQIDASRLTAHASAAVCQGVVQSTSSQLRVEFHLGAPPADLPRERRAWLTAMCVAAHSDRMVRVTVHSETGVICASVDLTACPLVLRDVLLHRAVDHLRAVVERLLPVVSVLNNPSVVSRALCSDAISPTAMEKDK